jgi:hypothetical protein
LSVRRCAGAQINPAFSYSFTRPLLPQHPNATHCEQLRLCWLSQKVGFNQSQKLQFPQPRAVNIESLKRCQGIDIKTKKRARRRVSAAGRGRLSGRTTAISLRRLRFFGCRSARANCCGLWKGDWRGGRASPAANFFEPPPGPLFWLMLPRGSKFTFAVAIGGKADMPFCTAYVR